MPQQLQGKMPTPALVVATPTPNPAPSRALGGDPVAAFVAAGGVIVMQEQRDDGTPGVEIHVPPDEWDDRWLAWFRRFVEKKQGTRRIRLVP